MSKLETIKAEIRKLPLAQAAELQDWLADYLESSAELKPEFVNSIERGNADLQEGRVRVSRPENGVSSAVPPTKQALKGSVLKYDQAVAPVVEGNWDAVK